MKCLPLGKRQGEVEMLSVFTIIHNDSETISLKHIGMCLFNMFKLLHTKCFTTRVRILV